MDLVVIHHGEKFIIVVVIDPLAIPITRVLGYGPTLGLASLSLKAWCRSGLLSGLLGRSNGSELVPFLAHVSSENRDEEKEEYAQVEGEETIEDVYFLLEVAKLLLGSHSKQYGEFFLLLHFL